MEEHTPSPFHSLTVGTSRSAIMLLEALITQAMQRDVSDIHIDPYREGIRVRFRTDGSLQPVHVFPIDIHAELIARLKILAGLRTDEHFAAQDGRFSFSHGKDAIDIRISVAPTYYGENAVLRLLSPQNAFALDGLGCNEQQCERIEDALRHSHGMILCTGPTGSGKTTMLYSLIRILAQQPISLVTLEDPVEYSIPGVNQIPVNERTGLTFSNGLRSVLRQDPDALMVGEIRDNETALLAAQAALTGHTVLSSLHTNSALAAIPRLMDMQVEPYLIATTLRMVIGARLVRRICKNCIVPYSPTHPERVLLYEEFESQNVSEQLYAGIGCEDCNHTGYKGRIGMFEVLPVSPALQDAISERQSFNTLKSIVADEGLPSFESGAAQFMCSGKTTLREVLRIRYDHT